VKRHSTRALPFLTSLCIAAFFLRFTAPSLHLYFSPDDSMNLYRSWHFPLTWLIKGNLLFFLNSPFYRPMVSVWYRSIYYFAGFNPAPFHAAILIVLAANMWLTYAVSRRLTGSREIGVLAALLVSYHPSSGSLYFDTGYAYDVICYFFYFSAFLFYLRVRQQARVPRLWEWAVFFVLYVCALNSKEMAITLPVFLGIYELLYQRVPVGSAREFARWIRSSGRLLIATVLVTAAFVAGRALDHHDSLLSIGPYKPIFTWERFMATSQTFLTSLFLRRQMMGAGVVLAIWLAMFAIAWVTRSRPLRFAWLFLMLSVIPIAFIAPRGAAQYYIPFFGWVLYTATILVRGTQYLWKYLPSRMAPVLQAMRALALFIAAGLLLLHYYQRPWRNNLNEVSVEQELQRSVVEHLHQLRPALRHGSRILFLDDPYEDSYRTTFLVRLSYRDDTLEVERAKTMQHPPDAKEIASYDYVFDYRLGRFFTSPQPRPQGPEPAITFEWGQADVFHSDFKRVTRQSPARPGEVVISMVKDLGDTQPSVPPGQPFPKDPLLDVAGPVSVRVGGQPVEVVRKIGWPQMVNHYRLDFPIPKNARPGEVGVEITASNVAGPAVMIPVE
jgi:hypothetical protein